MDCGSGPIFAGRARWSQSCDVSFLRNNTFTVPDLTLHPSAGHDQEGALLYIARARSEVEGEGIRHGTVKIDHHGKCVVMQQHIQALIKCSVDHTEQKSWFKRTNAGILVR